MNAAITERSSAILRELPERAEVVELRVKETSVELPLEVYEQVLEILTQLSKGHSVAIIPQDSEFTTKQAADFLNVSRPYLVKLLEEGAISFRKVGAHRRVKFQDLLEYKKDDEKARQKAFLALQKEAQDLDLGY